MNLHKDPSFQILWNTVESWLKNDFVPSSYLGQPFLASPFLKVLTRSEIVLICFAAMN